MKKTRFRSTLAFALSAFAAGCAGELDHNIFPESGVTTSNGGSTGTPTTSAGTSTGGTTGAGGSGPLPMVNPCVTTSLKACGQAVCHSALTSKAAGLNLTAAALTMDYKNQYYDKPNGGLDMYCTPGFKKLVDPVNPMQSLIYTKMLTPEQRDAMMKPPCGDAMPPEGLGMATTADQMCVLMWISDVIAGSKP